MVTDIAQRICTMCPILNDICKELELMQVSTPKACKVFMPIFRLLYYRNSQGHKTTSKKYRNRGGRDTAGWGN